MEACNQICPHCRKVRAKTKFETLPSGNRRKMCNSCRNKTVARKQARKRWGVSHALSKGSQ